ncbi:MAG: Hpt domain-containing protein [Deltaproteobacteria bacterium]|nr:Hpt domain-containing protein [Deltaproteobacteria bacterium]NNK84027.1 Hpt domain-containing protein [Desulfobacterales bacterium]
MDLKILADKLGLDLEDIKELLELYIETTTADLIELKGAIDAKDASLAHAKAHSIKGGSGNLGLDKMYELAKEIDDLARVNALDGLDNIAQVMQETFNSLVEEFEQSN